MSQVGILLPSDGVTRAMALPCPMPNNVLKLTLFPASAEIDTVDRPHQSASEHLAAFALEPAEMRAGRADRGRRSSRP